MYQITESSSARRALRRMQPQIAQRIREKLKAVAHDPYGQHNNVTKLQGMDEYRLRIGDYRALYTLHDDVLILHIVDVLPRGGAYKH